MGNGQRKNCSHALTPPGLMVTAATKCRCMKSLLLSSVSKKAVHECGEAIVDWIIFRGSSAGSALRGQTIVHRVYLRDTQNLSSQ